MAEQHVRYDDGVVGQVDGMKVPRYAGLTTFARLPRLEDVEDYDVAVVGVPFDSGVTYRPGARFGPAHIRQASRLLRPYNPALDAEPFRDAQVVDAGDITANPFDIDQAIGQTREGLRALMTDSARPVLSLGGDHTIALPGAAGRALAARAGGAGALRRPPRHLGHLLRRPVHARHAVPARVPRRACSSRASSAHVGIRGSLYDRQDLLDDAELGFTVVHCRDIERIGVDGVVDRILERVGDAPGLRLDRHRRARPGVRPRHGHPRGRRA